MSETIYTEKAYKELQSQANNLAVELINTKVAFHEAVGALRHTDAALRVLRTAVKKGIPNLPDSRLWGSATDRLEANTEILAKYQDGK